MSSGTPQVARDSTAVDYITWFQNYSQSVQGQNTAGTNFTPDYILEAFDTIDVTDAVSIGVSESLSDVIDITDSVIETNQNTGTFVYDTATYNFGDYA